MKPDVQLMYKVSDLTLRSLNGTLTEQENHCFEALLSSNPQAVEYYLEILWTHVGMGTMGAISALQDVDSERCNASQLLEALAEEEVNAPSIEISKAEPQRELIQKVVYPPREKRKLSKFNIFMLFNAAAVVLFFVILSFSPSRETIEVATLTDSINAKWGQMNGKMEKGASFAIDGEIVLLRDGYAELLFNNHARVTLEGPAEFQIITEDQIKLRHGRLYATVPQEAMGFTVTTLTAKVIDLGTEFGIEASPYGDTYLQVVKGKTTLIAGNKSSKSNIEVTNGVAKKVSGKTQAVSDAVYEDHFFVRDISSAEGVLWRGQTEFNLADVVGGGNGFGYQVHENAISIKDGSMSESRHGRISNDMSVYHLVSASAYVDGVFVPIGEKEPVQVSSQGHVFKECPKTGGSSWKPIRNSGKMKQFGDRVFNLEFEEQPLGTPENPGIILHPNAGITFDLDAVRDALPNLEISAFRTRCGISSNVYEAAKLEKVTVDGQVTNTYSVKKDVIAQADVYVLVDGELKSTATVTGDPKTTLNVDIKLNRQDRFLTLISTEGNDEVNFDWVVFVRPHLVLDEAE